MKICTALFRISVLFSITICSLIQYLFLYFSICFLKSISQLRIGRYESLMAVINDKIIDLLKHRVSADYFNMLSQENGKQKAVKEPKTH